MKRFIEGKDSNVCLKEHCVFHFLQCLNMLTLGMGDDSI